MTYEGPQINNALAKLTEEVARLPDAERSQIQPWLEQVQQSADRRSRVLTLVQEALGQLRLDIKYLMFDLEVTRNERDELQRQLDERGGGSYP